MEDFIISTLRENELRKALQEKDALVERQKKALKKIRRDRDLLNNELLEWKEKFAERGNEVRKYKSEIENANKVISELKERDEQVIKRISKETELYRKNMEVLLERNEKQGLILHSLVEENKVLRKGPGHVKLPYIKNTSRLNAPRKSIA
eukprot:Seg508.14 transcript_id=Seg508.14/GoldUCD/mRNA.D3Y31 product="hypothetical protein" protein_id=Seg508.14/GoldUCD/D3Y31